MPVRYIEVEAATASQLRAYAVTVLALDGIPPNADRATVLSMMAPVFRGKTIALFEEAEELEAGKTRRTTKEVNGRTFVLMTLHRQDKAGGREPLFVALNGRGMYIPRGKPCWVPQEYINVLEEAVEWVYPEYNAGEDLMGGLKTPTTQHAYPFTLN
jgi:hypothetical protein